MKNTIKYILGIVVGVIGIASHAYAVNYPVYVGGGRTQQGVIYTTSGSLPSAAAVPQIATAGTSAICFGQTSGNTGNAEAQQSAPMGIRALSAVPVLNANGFAVSPLAEGDNEGGIPNPPDDPTDPANGAPVGDAVLPLMLMAVALLLYRRSKVHRTA